MVIVYVRCFLLTLQAQEGGGEISCTNLTFSVGVTTCYIQLKLPGRSFHHLYVKILLIMSNVTAKYFSVPFVKENIVQPTSIFASIHRLVEASSGGCDRSN